MKSTTQNNLYEMLLAIKDYRRAQGRMHELRLVIVLVIMATMSGFHGLRAMGDFTKKNRKELIEIFKPRNNRLPSYLTIGRVLQNIDFGKLAEIFHEWTIGYVRIDNGEWIAIDGKAIGGTLSGLRNKKQNFINLVSVFSSKKKQILQIGKIHNRKESEIPKVRELIKMLDLEGVIYTMDALHCQKETVKTIIESKSDYCIGVKGNQKKLYKQIKKNLIASRLASSGKTAEKNKNRVETRQIKVYGTFKGIDKEWSGLKSIIQIERTIHYTGGNDKGRIRKEIAYFISSLPVTTNAKVFNRGIRSHWSVENSLHYVKDKTFGKDSSRIRTKNAPENMSVIRNISINILRKNNYQNIAQAIRLISNNIAEMYQMILA